MSDQVLVAVISALGSALVAWITAHENRKKTEDKDDLEELEKEIVKTCLLEYLRTIRKYQVMDVTLEIDLDKRNKKIEEYNLTEEELTQAEKIKNEMQ